MVPAGRLYANAPPGRYVISTGTVYDSRTRLTWQQATDGGSFTQAQGASHCAALGGTWRLPQISELLTIVDPTRTTSPAIDLTAFPGTGAEIYWSATTYHGVSGSSWGVDFTDGGSNVYDATFTKRVRCVH